MDNCIIKLRMQRPVALLEIEAAVKDIDHEMQLCEGQAEVVGQPLGKACTLKFKGTAKLAMARVSKLAQLQRKGNT